MKWQDRFEIREKTISTLSGHVYYIVDKSDDRFVKNFRFYRRLGHARIAATHMFKAEQKRIEKLLLGQ